MQWVILLTFTLTLHRKVIRATDKVSEQEAANRACNGGVIIDASSRSGIMTTPLVNLYGRSRQTYANNLDCEWVIVKPENTVVEMRFLYNDLNIGDTVSFLEGTKVSDWFGWGRQSKRHWYNFKSNNNVTVKFRSDITEAALGFKLIWKILDICEPEAYACSKYADCWLRNPRRNISRCECKPGYFGNGLSCTEDVELQACEMSGGYYFNAEATAGVVTSPGFPEKYKNGINCKWTILLPKNYTVELTLDHMEMSRGFRNHALGDPFECWYDRVTIYDDDKKVGSFCGGPWCGGGRCGSPLWNEYTFTSNKITFHFHADDTEAHKGFKFSWRKIRVCAPERHSCSNNSNCWIKNNEAECICKEGFRGDGRTCQFSIAENSCLRGYTYSGTSGVIASPNFPDYYPHFKHCKWFIPNPQSMTVQMTFNTFEFAYFWDSHCHGFSDNDYMKIVDGENTFARYCDRSHPPTEIFVTSGRDVTVEFHSDGGGSRRGMEINWWYVEACEPEQFGCSSVSTCWIRDSGHVCSCPEGYSGDGIVCETESRSVVPDVNESACSGGITLTEPSGNITSPNFPLPYPNNAKCKWSIVQPRGTVMHIAIEEFELENQWYCDYDFLKLYDGRNTVGKYCGTNYVSEYTSATNKIVIFFKSDYAHGSPGFKLSWSRL